MSAALADRVAALSVPTVGGCRLWTGALNSRGYGQVWDDGRSRSAHRVAYELAVGPIPAGLVIDHLCGVRRCVEPAHLQPVTVAVNSARARTCPSTVNAAKTSCLRGHPLTGENLVVKLRGTRTPVRNCRTCTRDAAERRRRSTAAVSA